MQYGVICHLCSHLNSEHDIEKINGHEIISCKVDGCTCRGIHAQFHTSIAVFGLKKMYQIAEPIVFSLKIFGYSPGGQIILSIKKNDELKEIWSTKQFSHNPPGFPAVSFDMVYEFPTNNDKIKIDNPGEYVLNISVNEHEVQEKFTVSDFSK